MSQTYFLMILLTLSLTLLPPVVLKRSTWKQNARVRIMQDQKNKNYRNKTRKLLKCSRCFIQIWLYFELWVLQSNVTVHQIYTQELKYNEINFWKWPFLKLQLSLTSDMVTNRYYLFLLKCPSSTQTGR